MKKLTQKPPSSGNPAKEFAAAKDRSENALLAVAATIRGRRANPDPSSYTSRIVGDSVKIISKIHEECGELIEAGELLGRGKTRNDVIWEAADLLYFVLVYLENKDIEITDVLAELMRRRTSQKEGQRYPPIPD